MTCHTCGSFSEKIHDRPINKVYETLQLEQRKRLNLEVITFYNGMRKQERAQNMMNCEEGGLQVKQSHSELVRKSLVNLIVSYSHKSGSKCSLKTLESKGPLVKASQRMFLTKATEFNSVNCYLRMRN